MEYDTKRRWILSGSLLLVLSCPCLLAPTCNDSGNDESEARHRLLSDAELACLAAFGRDRQCDPESAGPPEDACQRDELESWYDSFGDGCLRAHISQWECHAELECGEDGCESEADTTTTTCVATADQ